MGALVVVFMHFRCDLNVLTIKQALHQKTIIRTRILTYVMAK